MLRGRILEDFYPSLVGERPMGLDPDVAAALAARPTTELCKNCMPDRKGEQGFRNDCYQSAAVVGQRV